MPMFQMTSAFYDITRLLKQSTVDQKIKNWAKIVWQNNRSIEGMIRTHRGMHGNMTFSKPVIYYVAFESENLKNELMPKINKIFKINKDEEFDFELCFELNDKKKIDACVFFRDSQNKKSFYEFVQMCQLYIKQKTHFFELTDRVEFLIVEEIFQDIIELEEKYQIKLFPYANLDDGCFAVMKDLDVYK